MHPVGKPVIYGYPSAMSDNVIKFQRPVKPKPPRQTPPWLRKVIVIAVIVLCFAAAYGYFALTNSGGMPTR